MEILCHLFVKARYALVKLQCAVQQVADVGRQNAVQHFIINTTDILEFQPVMCRVFAGYLSRNNRPLGKQPRHHTGKAQRNPRHFTSIKSAQIALKAGLIVIAKIHEISLSFKQQIHRIVIHTRHEQYVRRGWVYTNMYPLLHGLNIAQFWLI